MNPLKDITAAVVDALRDAGARGMSAHPSVNYYRKKATVQYFGGPPAEVAETALEPLVESGLLKSYTVTRFDQWTCGRAHNSAVHAWTAHEGRRYVKHIEDTDCELGCDHGDDYLTVDKLAELVESGETFRSTECVPLRWPEDFPHAANE